MPDGLSVHVILDNLSAHTAPEVKTWLAHKHRRRWHLHFTPTRSSWLNLVERWLKELTDKRLRRDVFTSVADLAAAITQWAEQWNREPETVHLESHRRGNHRQGPTRPRNPSPDNNPDGPLDVIPNSSRSQSMISWLQIAYGAVLSGVVAAAVLAVLARPHRLAAALAGGPATAIGAATWNAILHAAHGERFFTDAAVAVLPASWQDTASGVFALAAAGLLLGAAVLTAAPARRVAGYAVVCGLAAFLVDVYLY